MMCDEIEKFNEVELTFFVDYVADVQLTGEGSLSVCGKIMTLLIKKLKV